MVKVNADKLERIAFILKTVAHPIRLGIVELLETHGKLCVGEICTKLSTEQSLTSHHLANMKLKGLLNARREGKNVYYSIKEKEITSIISCLEHCNCNRG
ncbi:transcriptional regulator [Sphingobacteriales bacterium UPWRP_1]|nr:transcriptional regulator [Sphingobacteriales bacterium TSM_CSS]PSJ75574.1 transcriptional regulator [Sphingobacteriales bacterium UPWRP_1]